MIPQVLNNNHINHQILGYSECNTTMQFEIENTLESINPNLGKRYCNWISFFNVNYKKFSGIHSSLIEGITELANSSPLFKNQTQYEFQTSLNFFQLLGEETKNFYLLDKDDAICLINISLLVGNYPGMIVGSFKESFKCLSNRRGLRVNIHQLFENLFAKYETPYFLSRNLSKLSLEEIDVLMFLLQGNNLRKHHNIPFPISRKESYIFMHKLPKDLTFDTYILTKGILCSKLINTPFYNEQILLEFISESLSFQGQPYQFYKNLSFWKIAFEILCRIKWEDTFNTLGDYLDYFEYLLIDDRLYLLKGRTPESITNALDQWHREAEFKKLEKHKEASWRGITDKMFLIRVGGHNYRFKEITNGMELHEESNALKHCVFSYAERCIKGHTSIWSLQVMDEEKGFLQCVTIEVSDNKVIQARGKSNRKINNNEEFAIKEWCRVMEYYLEKI